MLIFQDFGCNIYPTKLFQALPTTLRGDATLLNLKTDSNGAECGSGF
jgi:hypothetical protein